MRAERDGLHLRYGGGEDSRLEHLRGDRFRVRWEDPSHAEGWNTTVDFILNQDGAAERVRLVIDDEACEGVRTQ